MDHLIVFLVGLASAGHCIGMCGGFVAPLRFMPAQLAYHVGRVATYGLLGAVMGLIGSFVQGAGRLAGVQGLATAAAGGLMIAWAMARWRGLTAVKLPAPSPLGASHIRRIYGALTRDGGCAGTLVLGMLLGFLPCGLVGSMEIRAAGAGNAAGGMTVMLLFGAGTVPGLLAFGSLSTLIGSRFRGRLDRAGALLVGASGFLAICRGLAENGLIPHLNPWLW